MNDLLTTYMNYVEPFKGSRRLHVWSCISMAAAVLERRVWMPLGGIGELYPNMYILLVAGAGSGKTTNAKIAVGLINEFNRSLGPANGGIKFGPDKATPAAIFERFVDCKKTIKGVPVKGEITQSAMYIFSTELSTYIKDIGGGSMADDMLKLYDCDDLFVKELKRDGRFEIHGPCLNFFGATTSSFLMKHMPTEASGTGLTARIIFATDNGRIDKDPEVPAGDPVLKAQLIAHIARIHRMKGPMEFDPDTREWWNNWFYEQEEKMYDIPDGSFMRTFYARKQPHVRKLAMILSAGRSSDRIVRLEDVKRAVEVIEEAEPYMQESFGLRDFSKVPELPSLVMGMITDKEISADKMMFKLFQMGYTGLSAMVLEMLETFVMTGVVSKREDSMGAMWYRRVQ